MLKRNHLPNLETITKCGFPPQIGREAAHLKAKNLGLTEPH